MNLFLLISELDENLLTYNIHPSEAKTKYPFWCDLYKASIYEGKDKNLYAIGYIW